jgi:hypothetical protein
MYAASFVQVSDRAQKSEIVPVDLAVILTRVVSMPITEWT